MYEKAQSHYVLYQRLSVKIFVGPDLARVPAFATPEHSVLRQLSFGACPHFLENPTAFSHGWCSQNLIFVSKHGVMKWSWSSANTSHHNHLTPLRSDRGEYKINREKLSFCLHSESCSMYVAVSFPRSNVSGALGPLSAQCRLTQQVFLGCCSKIRLGLF
jgi:hypothetical protein